MDAHQHRGHGVPDQREGEDRAPAESIGQRAEQAGAEEQAEEGRRRERCLIGEAEHALIAGGEDPVTDQSRTDVGGLEQIVEFEETTNRQQRDQSPDRGDGGQAVDAGGNLGGAYRVDAVALRGGGGVSSHLRIHFLLMEKLSLLSEFTDCEFRRLAPENRRFLAITAYQLTIYAAAVESGSAEAGKPKTRSNSQLKANV
ncbi:hypothetical protein EMIT093MI4_110117 [Pseudomonas sp. IT-93MI4]